MSSKNGLDFDVLEFCRRLRTSKQPPYTCPIVECSKPYKSMCGLQYHLVNFDHNMKKDGSDNPPQKQKPVINRKSKKKKGRPPGIAPAAERANPQILQPLSYSEAHKYVEFEIDDKIHRLLIDEVIPVISKHNFELYHPKGSSSSSCKNTMKAPDLTKLPEPKFTIIEDYNIPDAPPRPAGYIRFIEKSVEDMEGEVEYDMDEEDSAWLEIMNERRTEGGLSQVSVDSFELLMDRLEKESYFQMQTSNKPGDGGAVIDDDAVCCICTDGECQNTNVILFCDMCNLAVHQDCYGVPYIPEGQWLCRRCLQSPSRAVDCVLCPNNGGAFKQTDRGHWAHVVCALWIPEVRFANTVFLEPIDSIETIPPARWKLTCYLCKQRGVGACIQCHKTNCYSAFHVTCAQIHGLYMKMDAVDNNSKGGDTAPVLVQKIAYCGTHTPPDAEMPPKLTSPKKLAGKAPVAPVISIPIIAPEKIQEIGSLVSMPKKNKFIQRLIAYWTLKRKMRNGVPLLRRLQVSHLSRRDNTLSSSEGVNDIMELRQKLKFWQCLRQDLERVRLLIELIRKREKLKRELIKVKSLCLEMELCPLVSFLRRLLDLIRARDTGEIFIEPVDETEVPDYSEVVKHPMDLSTMRTKIDTFQYNSLQEFESDFYLMINNCLAYNSKDTVFYRAALKMRDQGGALLKEAYKELEECGLTSDRGGFSSTLSQEVSEKGDSEVDVDYSSEQEAKSENSLSAFDSALLKFTKIQSTLPRKEILQNLNCLLVLAETIRHGNARNKRIKLIKTLKAKIKQEKNGSTTPESRKEEAMSTDSEEVDNETSEDIVRHKVGREKENRKKEKKEETLKQKSEENDENKTIKVNRRKRRRDELDTSENPVVPEKTLNDDFTDGSKRTALPLENSAIISAKSSSATRRRGRPSKSTTLPDMNTTKIRTSDIFSTYRSSEGDVKSEESHSEDESCCSDCSGSETGSRSGSSSEWSESDDEGTPNTSSMEALDQLQLVWAKCRGYPWYPALIINPKMPRGYVHNGVPIPSPPADVIALANNYTEPVYLVLFFDTKRTWQWLPRNKLEPLGITYELDHIKLTESRKPADRKAVKKAYQEAMAHRTQIDKQIKIESPKKV